MKYSFLRYFWAQKCSQIWHKNVFKFFKFWGTTFSWGGQALVQKWGHVSVGGGGLAKFLPDGGSPSPPGKKPWMLTKEVWLIQKLKNSLGLLIFCGGCADLMPLSAYLCKKIKVFLSRTERFGSFLFCFFYSNLGLLSAESLQNGRFSFLLSGRKIKLVTAHKMASHLMDMNIIF